MPPATLCERSEKMFVTVTIGNNLKRGDHIIEDTTTLRAAFDKADVDYAIGVNTLDGAALQAGDLDKSFSDFNVKDRCFLYSVVKADNSV